MMPRICGLARVEKRYVAHIAKQAAHIRHHLLLAHREVAPQGTVDGHLQSLYGRSVCRMSTLAAPFGSEIAMYCPASPRELRVMG